MVQAGQVEAQPISQLPKLTPERATSLKRIRAVASGDQAAITEAFGKPEAVQTESAQAVADTFDVRKSLLSQDMEPGKKYGQYYDEKKQEIEGRADLDDAGKQAELIKVAEEIEASLQGKVPQEYLADKPISSLERIFPGGTLPVSGDQSKDQATVTTAPTAEPGAAQSADGQQPGSQEAGKKKDGAAEATETVTTGADAAKTQLIDAAQLAADPGKALEALRDKSPEVAGKIIEATQKDIAAIKKDTSSPEGQARATAFDKALAEVAAENAEELKDIEAITDPAEKQAKLEAFNQRMEVVALQRFLQTSEGEKFKPQSETQRLIAQVSEPAKTAATNLAESVQKKDPKGIAKALSEVKKQWNGMSTGEKIGFVLFLIALLQPFAPTMAAAILPIFMTGIPDDLAEGLQNMQRARKQQAAKAETTTEPRPNAAEGKVDAQPASAGGNVVATEEAAPEPAKQDDQSTTQTKPTGSAATAGQPSAASAAPVSSPPPQGTAAS